MLGRIAKGSRTALVTGGSRGIGKAIAANLAKRGYNLLLISDAQQELADTALEISQKYNVKTDYLYKDLATPHAAYEVHDYCLQNGFTIELLVNDAGTFIFNDVQKCSTERIENIITLHVTTVTLMCRLFGEDMAARKFGYILNVASYSKWMCYPGLSIYSASKNYIESFSKAYALEIRESGVKVMAVSPAGVTTNLYGLPDNLKKVGLYVGILWTPNLTARCSLNALFFGRRTSLFGIRSYVPGILNLIFLPLLALLPRGLTWIARQCTKSLQK